MADESARIVELRLDSETVLWRSADVEQERKVAIADLLEENHFRPLQIRGAGPWRLLMRIEEGRLAIDVADAGGGGKGTIVLGFASFRRPVREYAALCASYYQAIRNAPPSAIETIDMARRGLHDAAAELLVERLQGKADIDHDTARRLFTLISVLWVRK